MQQNNNNAEHTNITQLSKLDYDGYSYNTIQIGNQIWTTENLKATHYNDATDIPYLKYGSDWEIAKDSAMTHYGVNSGGGYMSVADANKYDKIFGGLYNFIAVSKPNFAPNEWRVPTEEDFNTLITFLGGAEPAAMQLKLDELEGGYQGVADGRWNRRYNESMGNNKSGFSAIPGGYRQKTCIFSGVGAEAYFWSTNIDKTNSHNALCLYLNDAESKARIISIPKFSGCSIRLVKDIEK